MFEYKRNKREAYNVIPVHFDHLVCTGNVAIVTCYMIYSAISEFETLG